jgi:DNA-directed RNA polymerase subunit RPC12/RpoP
MADINFDCPACGHNLEVDERGAGMTVPCPECSKPIHIPFTSSTTQNHLFFPCPNCNQSIPATNDMAGQLIDCPSCGQPIEVPFPKRPAPSTPPPPIQNLIPKEKQGMPTSTPIPQVVNGKRTIHAPGNRIKIFSGVGIIAIVAIIIGIALLQKREIKGSVFIVTQGGQNFKMGLVPVQIYTTADVSATVTPVMDSFIDVYRQGLDSLNDADKLYAQLEKAADDFKKTEGQHNALEFTLGKIAHLNGLIEAGKAMSIGVDLVNSIKGKCVTKMFDVLFNSKQPVAATKTDADGRFSVFIPKYGSYILAATANRMAGSEREEYYWLLKIDALPPNQEILISNDNLLDSPSSVSLIDVNSAFPEVSNNYE